MYVSPWARHIGDLQLEKGRHGDYIKIAESGEKRDDLWHFARIYRIDILTLYNVEHLLKHRPDVLRQFVKEARKHVPVVEAAWAGKEDLPHLLKWQSTEDDQAKFDGIVTEMEFWGPRKSPEQRVEELQELLGTVGALRGGNPQPREATGKFTYAAYLGHCEQRELLQVAQVVDLLMVHSYVPSYGGKKALTESAVDRLKSAYRAPDNKAGERPQVAIILSAESEQFHSDQAFMGDWLQTRISDNPLQEAEANAIDEHRQRFAQDTEVLRRIQWYEYAFLKEALRHR